MARVTVYKWKKCDINIGDDVESQRMATQAFIEKIGGVLIEGTGVEIDASDLEDGEQYTPKNYVSQNQSRQD